jgi:membrane protein DedA with SNARE-associated domain
MLGPMTLTQGFTEWVVSVMDALGAPGVGLLVALENLFPPIPSELILPLAGFTSSLGSMHLVSAIAWATIGSVLGALALYWVGRAFGHERIARWAAKLPLVDPADVERTVAWFGRHGRKAVFLGRMIPIFRSLISIPAGIERMSQSWFLLLTMAGSLIWNSLFVLAGFWVGENYAVIERYAGWFQNAVIVVVAAALVWWIVARVRRNRARRAASAGTAEAG